jgi:hypothetical protein
MDRMFLIAATIFLIINTISGLYMRVKVIPAWFANMPVSFATIRTKAPKGWVPLQILFTLSFIGALVLTWNNSIVRSYVLITLATYVLIGVSTGVYFVKEILAFSKLDKDTVMTPELLKRVERWQTLTTWRNILQVAGMVSLVIACFYL